MEYLCWDNGPLPRLHHTGSGDLLSREWSTRSGYGRQDQALRIHQQPCSSCNGGTQGHTGSLMVGATSVFVWKLVTSKVILQIPSVLHWQKVEQFAGNNRYKICLWPWKKINWFSLLAAQAERRPRPSSARRRQGRARGQRWGYRQACCLDQRSRPRGGTPQGRNSPDGQTDQTVWRIIRTRHGPEQTSTGKDRRTRQDYESPCE